MVGKHGKNIALSYCFSITFPLPSHCNKVGFILEDSTYALQLSQLQARHFAALEREIPQAESYPCSVRITLKRVRNSRPSCRTGQIIKRLMRICRAVPLHRTDTRYPAATGVTIWSVPNSFNFCSGSLAVRLEDGVVQLTEPLLRSV